jgi:hypothetical protein
MKKAITTGLVLLIILFLFVQNIMAIQKGIGVSSKTGEKIYLYKDYHALVVGVGDYDYWPDLRGAVKDAKELAEYLKQEGMNVSLLLNPTSRVLKRSLNKLTYEIGKEKDRAILFFYSGHGETETLATEEKLGYIVPKDCPTIAQDYMGFTEKAVSMNQIETYALRIRSKHVLMVFDSCFSGSVFASLKSVPTDISEKSNRPVRQFITAGNENEQVPDESVFKTCFIQGIDGEADYNKDGYVTGSELGMYLDTSVVNYSRGAQHPQYGKIRHPKLDKGDFVFAKSGFGELEYYKQKTERLEKEIEILRQQLKTAQIGGLKEEGERKKFEAEGQEPKIASLSDDNNRNIEPWSGIWRVEGHREFVGQWPMKQKDKTVVSTADSFYEFKGTVQGDKLKGSLIRTSRTVMKHSFELFLSSDGRSFVGKIDYYGSTIQLKGKRIE